MTLAIALPKSLNLRHYPTGNFILFREEVFKSQFGKIAVKSQKLATLENLYRTIEAIASIVQH